MPCGAGERALESLRDVDASVVPWFQAAAEQLLSEVSSPAEALARALAKVTGYSAVRVCEPSSPNFGAPCAGTSA